MPDLLEELRRCARDVVGDREILAGYRFDQAASDIVVAGWPVALVRAKSAFEVQAVMRVAARHSVPVVPRGAGSGLSGAANAIEGSVVLSLEQMRNIRDLDAEAMTATVEAGVINDELRAAARPYGLWYPPDPASMAFSTLGGNIATNAGGMCCVKYGVTCEAVMGLEVVLADGRIVRLGGRTRKDVVGYDLLSLLCGSEGTLGVITEATLRLLPAPKSTVTVAASFGSLAGAGAATASIARQLRPSALELMDSVTIGAVEGLQPMELDLEAAAMVFACTDAGGDQGRAEAAAMAALCEQHHATLAVISEDEAEGHMLMAARRMAYPALERMGATLLDDVAVPLPRVSDLVVEIKRIAEQAGLLIGTFGHAGDGNLHPTIVYDRTDGASVEAARSAFQEIVRAALALGGTATGEHGIGLLKRGFVDDQLGMAADLGRAIKLAFDPEEILNPGKGL